MSRPGCEDAREHPQEKILQTFEYNGITVALVEWEDTIWCGKVGYAVNNADEHDADEHDADEPNVDAIMAGLQNFASMNQPLEPDCNVCISINYLSAERPNGVMFAALTATECQPDGFDVYKIHAGQYMRIDITSADTANAIGVEPWRGGIPPYRWIGEHLAPRFGYKYGDDTLPIIEYYDLERGDLGRVKGARLYVPVERAQHFIAEEGSFLMPEIPVVLRALQALNAPEYISYDYLMSLSGMGVRLAWQQGWAGYDDISNQAIYYNEDGKSCAELALDRVGAKYAVKKIIDIKTAQADIKSAIDQNLPVLLSHFAVLGYDGFDLYGVSPFTNPEQRVPPHNYNKIDWENDARVKSYIIIEQYAPKELSGATFIQTLKTAIYLARTSKTREHGDTALGLASFDAAAEMMVWDESFEPLEVGKNYDGALNFPYDRPDGYYHTDGARNLDTRFSAGYCDYLCMLFGYNNFAEFLDKYSCILPEQSESIKQAAQYYRIAAQSSGALWEYIVPPDNMAKFKEKNTRYAFAAHMLRAKMYTIKAVEILEKIV